MKITIVGTGYVGLVTGACFAYVGNDVCCLDIDEIKINNLKNQKNIIYEEKLDKIISKSVEQKRLTFTSCVKSSIKQSNIIFLAVNTPMKEDGVCNLDYIYNAAKEIGKYIDEHKIIVVKSTVPVGTTNKIKNIIEEGIKKRKENITFDIANNPEYLKEGSAVDDFMSPDRIIVGLENEALIEVFYKLYRPFSMNREKLIFLDIASSELTKYAANAMLAMKISFINEISQFCEKVGADINSVRIGIGSDNRIGYNFIYPSIGFGGSCFPKDVNSLIKQFEQVGLESLLPSATLKINKIQYKNFASRIITKLKDLNEINIAVWGITFKPGTNDIRESQAIKIIDILLDSNININIYDPQGMENGKKYFKNSKQIKFYNDKNHTLKGADALVLLTEWEEFRSPDFKLIKKLLKAPIIFDGRNIFNKQDLKKLGFDYYQIGVKGK